MSFNADLHTYGWLTFERGTFELPGVSYRGERSLKTLVDRCTAVGLDMIGFVNFGDRRFEQLYETAKSLPQGYLFTIMREKGQPIGLAVLPPLQRLVYILRGQQVLTKDGHVLVLGAPQQFADNQPIERTLQEARDLGALIIAPGPSFVQGKNVEGTVPGRAEYTSPLATQTLEKTFDRFHSFFDAVETFSASPWPRSFRDLFRLKQQNEASALFAQRYDIPAITVSEAHALSHLGHAYISLPTPIRDYEPVLEKLREQLKSKEYTAHQETVSLPGMARCLAADLWNHFRVHRGWLQIRRE